MDYEIHEDAHILPLLEGEELDALASDIQAHGLIEPILLYEGKIIDGRNRLRACELIGLEPTFQETELDGLTPLEFVLSKNLHRRHLTAGQRAALALSFLPRLKEEAKQRKGIGRPPDATYEETIQERRERLGEPGRVLRHTHYLGDVRGDHRPRAMAHHHRAHSGRRVGRPLRGTRGAAYPGPADDDPRRLPGDPAERSRTALGIGLAAQSRRPRGKVQARSVL